MFNIASMFGISALIVWISSVQAKEKKDILLLQGLANLFYVFHYYLLGLISTSSMNLISVIRCLIFSKYAKNKKQPSLYLLLIFLFIIIVLGLFYCRSFLDFLPIFATLLYAISGWVKSNTILRYTYIFCACLFFYYNYTVGAYIPLIGNIGELLSGFLALYRFKNKKTV